MWRELVRFGRHVIAAGIVQRVGEQADRVLVGRFVSTSALGQYQYALRLAMAPFEATLAVASHVLFPAFARISHDRERLSSAYLRSLRWVMVAAMPASLILFPLGEPLTVVLFGEVWRPAGHALMAMCLFAAGNSLLSICLEGAKAYGRPAVLARVHLFMMVVTVAAMVALLPLGLNGVAAGLSVGAVAGAIYAVFSFSRLVSLPVREIWAAGLGAGRRGGADGGGALPGRAPGPPGEHPRRRGRPGPARGSRACSAARCTSRSSRSWRRRPGRRSSDCRR